MTNAVELLKAAEKVVESVAVFPSGSIVVNSREELSSALRALAVEVEKAKADGGKPCEFCGGSGVVRVKDPHPVPVTADCPEGCPR